MDSFWEAPESRRIEFKETFPEGEAVTRSVIAFANGAGGRLVFGIKDFPRRVTGIPDHQEKYLPVFHASMKHLIL